METIETNYNKLPVKKLVQMLKDYEANAQYQQNLINEKDKEIEELEKYKVFTKSLLEDAKKRSDKDKEGVMPNWIIQHIAKLLNKRNQITR